MLIPQENQRTVHLVNPRSPGENSHIGPMRMGVPIGLGVVGSAVESIRNELGFADEVGIKVIDENLGEIIIPKPGDLVLVSSFSLTSGRVETLIREVAEKGGYTVAGGIHATVRPEDFTKIGGISFQGEAANSIVFGNLLEQWLHGGVIEAGSVYTSEGLTNPESIKLANLPVSREIYRALDKNTYVSSTFATVGCPYDCGFCTVMAGRVVRKRPVEEVVGEIKLRGLDKRGFVLADSNLGAGGDKYLHSLLERLAKLNIPRGWASEISVNLLDRGGNRLLDALEEAQCHRMFVGIESPFSQNLESVGKSHNLGYDGHKVKEIVRKAHQRGIKITGLFVVGFLPETVESIRGIEQYIGQTSLDGANIFILTPLPGNKIWDEFTQQGIFNPDQLDTDDLDLRHLVFQHPLGDDAFLQEYRELCKKVYSAPAILSRGTRAFFMSIVNQLPRNLWQAFSSSFGMEFLQADDHRKLGMVDFANRVYEIWRRLGGKD